MRRAAAGIGLIAIGLISGVYLWPAVWQTRSGYDLRPIPLTHWLWWGALALLPWGFIIWGAVMLKRVGLVLAALGASGIAVFPALMVVGGLHPLALLGMLLSFVVCAAGLLLWAIGKGRVGGAARTGDGASR